MMPSLVDTAKKVDFPVCNSCLLLCSHFCHICGHKYLGMCDQIPACMRRGTHIRRTFTRTAAPLWIQADMPACSPYVCACTCTDPDHGTTLITSASGGSGDDGCSGSGSGSGSSGSSSSSIGQYYDYFFPDAGACTDAAGCWVLGAGCWVLGAAGVGAVVIA